MPLEKWGSSQQCAGREGGGVRVSFLECCCVQQSVTTRRRMFCEHCLGHRGKLLSYLATTTPPLGWDTVKRSEARGQSRANLA